MLKGATAGLTTLILQIDSGTAIIEWDDTNPAARNMKYQNASEDLWTEVVGVAKVTGAGTLVLGLYGTSAGSNGALTAGEGQIYALALKGS